MKDIKISADRQKKELLVFIVCLVVAFILNIVAIVIYKTNWTEVISYIGYVIAIAIVLYILIAVIRGLVQTIRHLFRRK